MPKAQIQIVTRGGKRCAPNCMLHRNGGCAAGLSPNGVAVGPDCPKDGLWELRRASQGPSGETQVQTNLGKGDNAK